MHKQSALTVALMALLYSEGHAWGNGRFPKADMLVSVPESDGRDLYLRSTFGILVSHDAGKRWEWICEEALGFSGTWDPPIALSRSGVLYVGLQSGLQKVLRNCESKAVTELEGERVSDVSVDGSGKHALVVTSPADRQGAYYVENEQGAFEKRASLPEGYTWDTVDAAPSLPARVYMTGVRYPEKPYAHFLRSKDGGKTFEETHPKLAADGRLFLSAVDASNPEKVFVRQIGDDWTELLVSTNGGSSFESVLRTKSSILGFALSADGRTAWAAAGDPKEGLYRSDDGGAHFSHVADASLVCLHANKSGLFGCSNPMTRGGPLLYGSNDRGNTVATLSTFADIQGPLACQKSCAATWAQTLDLVRGVPPKDAGAIDAAPTLGPSASAPAVPVASTPPAPKRSCGCHAVGKESSRSPGRPAGWMAVGSFVAAMLVRRRHTKVRATALRSVDPHGSTVDNCNSAEM